jgi:hypothetical protein
MSQTKPQVKAVRRVSIVDTNGKSVRGIEVDGKDHGLVDLKSHPFMR